MVEGGVLVARVPEHDGVDDQAERAELDFLPFPVALPELSPLAVEDGPGKGMTAFGYVPACISQGPPSVSLSSRVLILSVALRRASRSLGPRTSMNSSRTRLTCPGAASVW